jgi:ATP-binding cassette subfamily F protein uup
MRNPNFLVLDEPTNDLDIVTLQILEEYLQDFPGCVIVVSHDRYFMDKVVDHLLVFEGDGRIKDFPGNYTQYRQWQADAPMVSSGGKTDSGHQGGDNTKKKAYRNDTRQRLTYKQRLEMQQLEKDIALLEDEQKRIENALCSGTLSVDELTAKSKRLPQLKDELDEKSMRWLELSEIEN